MPVRIHSRGWRYRYDAIDHLMDLTVDAQEPLKRFFRQSRLISEIQGDIRLGNVLEGDELGELLAKQYDLEQFGSIRILICFSADTGADPRSFPAFGQLLAESTRLPVKAFHSGVRSKDITLDNFRTISESSI